MAGLFQTYQLLEVQRKFKRLPSFTLLDMATPTHLNPLGVKGIGEAGTIGATPCVVNAVVDAPCTDVYARILLALAIFQRVVDQIDDCLPE